MIIYPQKFFSNLSADFDLPTGLIVSCPSDPNGVGGLFHILFREGEIQQIAQGDFRGFTRTPDGYIVASRDGLTKYNVELQQTAHVQMVGMDYHGVALWSKDSDYVLAAETNHNRLGIYRLDTLDRIGEVVFHENHEDENHLNDIFVDINEGVLFVSMFSATGKWKEAPNSARGVIIKINLSVLNIDGTTQVDVGTNVIREHLFMPHSVSVVSNAFVYCNSMRFNAVIERTENEKEVLQFQGFTRGIEVYKDTYFVGQSVMRHLDRVYQRAERISMDAGIFVLRRADIRQRFILLPVQQIYQIMSVDTKEPFDIKDAVDFNVQDDLAKWLVRGEWHEIEWYRWMSQLNSRFQIQAPHPGEYRLCLDIFSAYPEKYKVEVSANDCILRSIDIPAPGTYMVEIPLYCSNHPVIITLHVPFLWSPSVQFGTGDIRFLGIGVHRAALFPAVKSV